MNDFEKKLDEISKRVIDKSYSDVKTEIASKTYNAIYVGKSADDETWYRCGKCEMSFSKNNIRRNDDNKKCCPKCMTVMSNL